MEHLTVHPVVHLLGREVQSLLLALLSSLHSSWKRVRCWALIINYPSGVINELFGHMHYDIYLLRGYDRDDRDDNKRLI